MKTNLKTNTINGFIWSFVDNFSVQFSQFAIGVVLARLLDPKDFGLIGMMVVFITISQWFVSSGFGQALIRKKDCSQEDYSTVFIFNILVGLFFYLLLYFSSDLISKFFDEPRLNDLIKVYGICIVIISLTIVQQTQLTKRLDFKLQTKISIITSFVSGVIAILLAYNGHGVWSLVYKSLIEYSLKSMLLWVYSSWTPSFVFDFKSFKSLFNFGYKLMLRGLIYTMFSNLYYVVIGKYFSASQLGFFTRAEQFNRMPSSNINKVFNKVSYPVLSQLQDDDESLKKAYRKIFTTLVFITSISMLGLAAIAEPLILVTVGEKWAESIPFLQLLCFVGLLYPLADFNLTILKVKGMSGLILKLELVKRLFSIPVIIIGVYYGIRSLIVAMILLSFVEFLLNAYYSGRQISYSLGEQVLDNLPSILIAAVTGGLVYFIESSMVLDSLIELLISISVGFICVVLMCEVLKNKNYMLIKVLVLKKVRKFG